MTWRQTDRAVWTHDSGCTITASSQGDGYVYLAWPPPGVLLGAFPARFVDTHAGRVELEAQRFRKPLGAFSAPDDARARVNEALHSGELDIY